MVALYLVKKSKLLFYKHLNRHYCLLCVYEKDILKIHTLTYSGQGVLAEQLLQVPHCAQHECVTGKRVTQDHREVPVRDSHTQSDHRAVNLYCVH